MSKHTHKHAAKTGKRKSLNQSFLEAAGSGDFDGVRFFFNEGASLQARDDRGRTALHIAAELGLTKTMDALIDIGAPLDARDQQNETPLMRAVRQTGGYDASEKLIMHGADVTLKNNKGDTAFTMVKGAGKLKQILQGAWLAALEKNPIDMNIATSQDLHIKKPLKLKAAAPPQ